MGDVQPSEQWSKPEGDLGREIKKWNNSTIDVYLAQPERIEEARRSVENIAQGDYRTRQIFELIQNGADAIIGLDSSAKGKVKVVLTPTGLYCANQGAPFTLKGVKSVVLQNWSSKVGNEIGRYGLGFKSVLATTKQPRIFSRSVSLLFDAAKAATYLNESGRINRDFLDRYVGLNGELLSILAIPTLLDPDMERSKDDVLNELMEWATTVIHLPFDATFGLGEPNEIYSIFKKDLDKFSAEFLIFANHLSKLELEIHEDSLAPDIRTIQCERTASKTISESGADSHVTCKIVDSRSPRGSHHEWDLFIRPEIRIEAHANDLAINRRKDESGNLLPVPLYWAVPRASASALSRGKFWVFFPTFLESSLRGIFNAPWDTDGTRTHVTETSYNKELVHNLAELVIAAIPILIERSPDDLSDFLELLPARGDEETNPVQQWVVTSVRNVASRNRSIPNIEGTLVEPSTLRRYPELVNEESATLWALSSGAAMSFPHPTTIKNKQRSARVREYIFPEEARSSSTLKVNETIEEWLELLVQNATHQESIEAIRVAGVVSAINSETLDASRRARIVLTQIDEFFPPIAGSLFLPRGVLPPSNIPVVNSEVVKNESAFNVLRDVFALTQIDDAAGLEVCISSWPEDPKDKDWEQLWSLIGTVAPDRACEIIKANNKIHLHVLMMNQKWLPVNLALVAGVVVLGDKADEEYALDLSFHRQNQHFLNLWGLGQIPTIVRDSINLSPDYQNYLTETLEKAGFSQQVIKQACLSLPDDFSHLHIMKSKSDLVRSRMTTWITRNIAENHYWEPPKTRLKVLTHSWWTVLNYGRFENSLGVPLPIEATISSQYAVLSRIAPILQFEDSLLEGLQFVRNLSELNENSRHEILERLGREVDHQTIGRGLALLCKFFPKPENIRCRVRDGLANRPPEEVFVVSNFETFGLVAAAESPVVLVDTSEEAEFLRSRWGLKSESDLNFTLENSGVSETRMLCETFPILAKLYPDFNDVQYATCSTITRIVNTPDGQSRSSLNDSLAFKILYVRRPSDVIDQSLIERVVLEAANRQLGLSLTASGMDQILVNAIDEHARRLMNECRSKNSDSERIATLLSAEEMRSLLPSAILKEIGQSNKISLDLATMVQAVHGSQLLQVSRVFLEEKGLQVPQIWAGGHAAIKFVSSLGFDRSFAGFKIGDRSAHTEVKGSSILGDLHEYQKPLCLEVKEFLSRAPKDKEWRKLLYMPTGSGKTRVAVQAIVESLNEGFHDSRPIIWIAQSDELCEQAISAFRELWSSIGRGDLSLDRLWASNEVDEADLSSEYSAQVVVATIDKLISIRRRGNESYDWLSDAAAVIIDEAHKALEKSYTEILGWFETGRRLNKSDRDKRPLLGLSATPANPALKARFGNEPIRVNPDSSELTDIEYLRIERFLARAKHVEIEGEIISSLGGSLPDTENRRMIWLPTAVEESLADNSERNKRIIQSILALPSDATILLFAISVAHAQVLAGLLNKNGVKSVAISAETSPGARQHYIRQFKDGDIRVLTNYGVLTTGFDAPKVSAIFITRPTFSRALYLQMIGRGLRGPRNGGTEECLIVDIKDNLEAFGHIDLVYKSMGWWWGSGDVPVDEEIEDE
jgi:superfamily II DNA or RNA helicase